MKARHQAAQPTDLGGALEQGLGVQVTKIGSDAKQLAYAMPQSRARWFAVGILAALFTLAVLTITYAELFNDERILRAIDMRTAMMRMGEQKMESVRLGMALHQQHAVREHQEEDAMRALNRIHNVITKRFDDFIAKQTGAASPPQIELESFRNELQEFVAGEIANFQSISKTIDLESQATLENLAKLQEQSLRDLLKNVNGVKMEAFEDMLRDVFAAGERAPDVDLPGGDAEQLEMLVDGLYEEKISLEEARKELDRIRRDRKWPVDAAMVHAQSEVDFAQAVEQLVDDGKLSKGKRDIASIAKQWEAAVDLARTNKENEREEQEENNDGDGELGEGEEDEDFDEEIKANVDALLAIHKLVAQGKVPFHLLDFEAIDMKDLQYDGENQEEENGGEDGDDEPAEQQQQQPDEAEQPEEEEEDAAAGKQEDVADSEASPVASSSSP